MLDDDWNMNHTYLFRHLLPRRNEILNYIHEWRALNSKNDEEISPLTERMEEIFKFWTNFDNTSSDTLKYPSLIIVQEIMKLILEFLNEFSFLFTFVNSQNGDAYGSSKVQDHTDRERDNHLLYFLWKDNYSTRVPKAWREYLEKCSDIQLIELMNFTQQEYHQQEDFQNYTAQYFSDNTIPSSFRRFVLGCKLLRFHKVILPSAKEIVKYLTTDETNPKQCFNDSDSSSVLHCQYTSSECQNTELLRHMSPKKIHEIERLAEFISTFSQHTFSSKLDNDDNEQIPTILDIGSGKGYLSHVLFAKYGLNIIAVDHNEQLVQKIQEKTKKFDKSTSLRSKQNKQQKNQLKAISSHLECNREQLSKMVNQMLETTRSIYQHDDRNGGNNCIVGLHTCGDLTPILCDMYLNDTVYTKQNKSLIHSLVNVGCCYHKLTETYHVQKDAGQVNIHSDSSQALTHFHGFPLTSFVNNYITCNLNGFQLTRSGLILGCTENNIWNVRNVTNGDNHETSRNTSYKVQEYWKRNAFRCAMEYFLHEYVEKKTIPPTIRRPVVYSFGSISDNNLKSSTFATDHNGHNEDTDFSKYATSVLVRLYQTKTLDPLLHEQEIIDMASTQHFTASFKQQLNHFYYQQCHGNHETSQIKSVDIFWTLRSMIGPVIECLILLDRYLFLSGTSRGGVQADLVQLFDEDISPRGIALFAYKK
ncbi:hypothetical protein C9374_007302 [Naegleria lovaniensis]|uniref:Methyltransferase domain-containing protein n=1 Tax=Naegleria lovaniensis TaxID=51637 RepID=A0AA88KS17_NAELO|nr:uncharacterized protein C9374_007302 [Naegleria lovaniensis]KAG2393771.1 hypothetical protein C9374_007302 [Naegleria lovaniensis]